MSATLEELPVAPAGGMSRWKASGIHLLLSAAIGSAVVAVMLTLWYPGPLFEAAGGSGLIFILGSVDVVIGPLITLVIFKPGKWGLRFDLAVIALLQVAALIYGLHTVYVARPAYLVYTVDRFNLVTVADLDPADVAQAPPEFRVAPLTGPRYIGVRLPTDPKERLALVQSALAGKDAHLFPQRYVPYESLVKNALARSRDIAELNPRDHDGLLAQYLRKSGRSPESVRYLPLRARIADGVVLLDAKSGEPLRILLIDPW